MQSSRRSIINPQGHNREHDSLFSTPGLSAAGAGSRFHAGPAAAPAQRRFSWIEDDQNSDGVNMTQVLGDKIKGIFQKRHESGAYSLDAHPRIKEVIQQLLDSDDVQITFTRHVASVDSDEDDAVSQQSLGSRYHAPTVRDLISQLADAVTTQAESRHTKEQQIINLLIDDALDLFSDSLDLTILRNQDPGTVATKKNYPLFDITSDSLSRHS